MPKGKHVAKRRFWRRFIWRKRRANNLVGRSPIYRRK